MRILAVSVVIWGIAAGSDAAAATIVLKPLPGGAVRIEGQTYSGEKVLNEKLVEVSHRKPKPDIVIVGGPGSDFHAFAHIIQLLQNDGFRVGFLMEPRSTKPQ